MIYRRNLEKAIPLLVKAIEFRSCLSKSYADFRTGRDRGFALEDGRQYGEVTAMKQCVKCRQLFADKNLRFCRFDGSPLVDEVTTSAGGRDDLVYHRRA